MDNEALGKRKICSRRGEESLAVSAFQKSGKTLAGREKFQKRRFYGKSFKNESIFSAVSVGYFSSQNFKDEIEARKQMDKDNFIEYQSSFPTRFGIRLGK